MGEYLRQAPKATGGDAQRTRFQKVTESPPTLADLGISKKESANAQALAEMRQEDRQRAQMPQGGGGVIPGEICRQAKPWAWGRGA